MGIETPAQTSSLDVPDGLLNRTIWKGAAKKNVWKKRGQALSKNTWQTI